MVGFSRCGCGCRGVGFNGGRYLPSYWAYESVYDGGHWSVFTDHQRKGVCLAQGLSAEQVRPWVCASVKERVEGLLGEVQQICIFLEQSTHTKDDPSPDPQQALKFDGEVTRD